MQIDLNGRLVGDGCPPYIIAEIGSNHNGDIDLAKKMIDQAKECGADAVKFQSWSSKSLISEAEYDANTEYADKDRHFGSLREMVEKYQFTEAQHEEVADYCRGLGIQFMSSPFSPKEVDLLVDLGVPALKLASMDVNHPVLLQHAAASGKPIILSTGLSDLSEVARAVAILRDNGCKELILLHCISIYPPEYADINLNNIPMLRDTFRIPVGLSDHSLGTAIPIAAAALGACVIEKHYTLDKSMEGWDHWMSVEPAELEEICTETRNVHTALGSYERIVSDAELEKRKKFRRCIVASHNLDAGHVIELEDLDFKRPGTGIPPEQYPFVVGRTVKAGVASDQQLAWSDFV